MQPVNIAKKRWTKHPSFPLVVVWFVVHFFLCVHAIKRKKYLRDWSLSYCFIGWSTYLPIYQAIFLCIIFLFMYLSFHLYIYFFPAMCLFCPSGFSLDKRLPTTASPGSTSTLAGCRNKMRSRWWRSSSDLPGRRSQHEPSICFNFCVMSDLRFEELMGFIHLHDGPILFHCGKGSDLSCSVAALVRMVLRKETAGKSVSCRQWCGLVRTEGCNFTSVRTGMVTLVASSSGYDNPPFGCDSLPFSQW